MVTFDTLLNVSYWIHKLSRDRMLEFYYNFLDTYIDQGLGLAQNLSKFEKLLARQEIYSPGVKI